MPSYDYSCKNCGNVFTINKSMNDSREPDCPACQSPNVTRIWSGVQFKGCGGGSSCSSGGGCSSCGGCH